ncbi:hypothetical protein FBZ94_10518 [Bradyrhizobium sacchari]|uniref:Uncharacterized protein n=1 Tax=Bradyrhizobium sacchari TaxID=1399419 RepID=A0A560II66_9BRAD|nr:hypothetical protein FBZ94_10518 [Bradyrhizobium sacchari]TWB72898.1 hypothetical protein FBZ95_106613 [Bradyrhizobium sacchari]
MHLPPSGSGLARRQRSSKYGHHKPLTEHVAIGSRILRVRGSSRPGRSRWRGRLRLPRLRQRIPMTSLRRYNRAGADCASGRSHWCDCPPKSRRIRNWIFPEWCHQRRGRESPPWRRNRARTLRASTNTSLELLFGAARKHECHFVTFANARLVMTGLNSRSACRFGSRISLMSRLVAPYFLCPCELRVTLTPQHEACVKEISSPNTTSRYLSSQHRLCASFGNQS